MRLALRLQLEGGDFMNKLIVTVLLAVPTIMFAVTAMAQTRPP